MTDVSKTPEQRAADRLADAIIKNVNGCTGAQVAVAAFASANKAEAALQGLVRLLVHKGILSHADLGDSMAWGYDERAQQLLAQSEKGSIIATPPPAPHARGSN